MKSISFRTARKEAPMSVRKLGAGLLMMGLALTASAKDGSTSVQDQMTCAHPTLPMGTWLRVTNLKNRRMAFVRVNDRGPVLDGRIVDLSRAAARAVGLTGIGKVKLETVRQNDPDLAKALVAQLEMPVLFSPLAH